jgi:hypothetical protein
MPTSLSGSRPRRVRPATAPSRPCPGGKSLLRRANARSPRTSSPVDSVSPPWLPCRLPPQLEPEGLQNGIGAGRCQVSGLRPGRARALCHRSALADRRGVPRGCRGVDRPGGAWPIGSRRAGPGAFSFDGVSVQGPAEHLKDRGLALLGSSRVKTRVSTRAAIPTRKRRSWASTKITSSGRTRSPTPLQQQYLLLQSPTPGSLLGPLRFRKGPFPYPPDPLRPDASRSV